MYTQEQVNEWKEQYQDIFAVIINEQHFVYRMIGRAEYNIVMSMEEASPTETEEILCELATLYPEGFNFRTKDGYATSLCSMILESSMLNGPETAEQLLTYYRDEMTDYNAQIDCVIHEAYPQFTLEEIAAWPVPKTMFYLSRAEWTLQNLRGVPLQHYTEEELRAMQTQQQMQVPPTTMMSPQQRAEMSPLANPEMPQQQQPKQGDTSRKELTQQELEMMMSQAMGERVDLSKKISDQSYPELAFFGTQDQLRGEFD